MYHEFVRGFSLLIGYFAVCVALVFVLRKFVTLPKEVARKSLHMILLGSVFIWVYGFNTWWVAALTGIGVHGFSLPDSSSCREVVKVCRDAR